jgi:queuine tRNA-ribosyltransferase
LRVAGLQINQHVFTALFHSPGDVSKMAAAPESLKELKGLVFKILGHFDAGTTGPRLGRLAVKGHQELETPNFLAVGSRGVVPHLAPDVISAHTKFGGVHMALEDCKFHLRGSRAGFPI